MKAYDVYSTSDNWFFSAGVTREFGENRHVILHDGSVVSNVVQPLNPESIPYLSLVGEIMNVEPA